jgi:tetratricopeptide (TPR) repeat protein
MSNNKNEIRKDLNQPITDFDKESQEGWEKIGMEHLDSIQQRLDQIIDKELSMNNAIEVKIVPIQKSNRFPFKMSIAAMILITLGLSIKFVFDQPAQNIQLFETYYKPLEAPEDNFRSEEKNEAINENARIASDAYDDLEYKKAIGFYTELLNEFPNNSKYTLFLGLSYINDGKFDEAINLYNLHTSNNTPYDEDIKWYLALAHLRKGEIQTSKLLFENIALDSKNYYAHTADEIVNKLSKLK